MTCEQQIGWAAHLPGGFEFRTHERGAARCCVVERQACTAGSRRITLPCSRPGSRHFATPVKSSQAVTAEHVEKVCHAKTRRRKERRLREGIFAALRLCVTLPGNFFNTLSDTAHSPEAGA